MARCEQRLGDRWESSIKNDETNWEFNDGNRKRRKGNGENNKIDKQECIFGQRHKGWISSTEINALPISQLK